MRTEIAHNAVGQILWIAYAPDSFEGDVIPKGDAPFVLETDATTDAVNVRQHFVLDGVIAERQPFPFAVDKTTLTADGVDEVVISDVPVDASVTWPDGQADIVTDGEVRFSVDLAGTYVLKFSAVAYLDQEVTLEAVVSA